MPPRPPWIVVLFLLAVTGMASGLFIWLLGCAAILGAWWRLEIHRPESFHLD